MICLNGNYYSNPTFPGNEYVNQSVNEKDFVPIEDVPMQQSYIENILRHNKGKKVKAYVSFPDSAEWKDRIFEGTIEQAGRDHLIIKDIHFILKKRRLYEKLKYFLYSIINKR